MNLLVLSTILLLRATCCVSTAQPGEDLTVQPSPLVQPDKINNFDLECGGTHFHQESLQANTTVEVGRVPAGLYWFAVHLWSDEDLDIQIVSADGVVVVHWQEGLVRDGETVVTTFRNDTFTYSGHGGSSWHEEGSAGNENIIFKGFTHNSYRILAFAKEDGHAKVRYGWLPLPSCNIRESRYQHFDMDTFRRNLRDGLEGESQHSIAGKTAHRSLATANVRNTGNYDILHNYVQGHTELTYGACWDALRNSDENPSNSGQVIGIHSRKGIPKSYQDGSSSCGGNRNDCWNREHVWAKSRGDFGTSRGAGTDLHALRPEDRSVNTERSNKNIDYVSGGTPVPDCPDCWESSTAFEPANAGQGPVARMLFYMAVRYNGDSGSNGVSLNLYNGGSVADCCGKEGRMGDLATLKSWATSLPVTADERRRNNIIEAWYQGNRNPFIDFPEYINYVW